MFHMNKPLIARPYNPMSVAAPHASWVAAEFTKKNHTCHALDHVERPPTLVSKRTHLFFLLTAPLTIEIATPYNSAEAREYFNPHALETSILGENPIDLGYFASQGGQLRAGGPPSINLARGRQGSIAVDVQEGVDIAVDGLDAIKMRFDDLYR